MFADLKGLIDAHESAIGRDYEARLAAQHQARAALDDLVRRQEQQQGNYPPHGEGSEVNESRKWE